jgi:O-acetyl-ADP-ribose deacetylase (regulator of RNase III)
VKGLIHAVGPVYHGGTRGEASLLASAWRSALAVADDAGFRSVAFPSISTGIYGYPLPDAALVVGTTLAGYLNERRSTVGSLELVRIVLRDQSARDVYDRGIATRRSNGLAI